MYDREFFTSKLGLAALVSVVAMVTFNVVVVMHDFADAQETTLVSAPIVALA